MALHRTSLAAVVARGFEGRPPCAVQFIVSPWLILLGTLSFFVSLVLLAIPLRRVPVGPDERANRYNTDLKKE